MRVEKRNFNGDGGKDEARLIPRNENKDEEENIFTGSSWGIPIGDPKAHEEEVEMEIEVTLERPYELYEESKEYQPLVLRNPTYVSRVFMEFETRMEQKGHLETLCGVDSYVDSQDYMGNYSLEVQYKLKTLKEDMPISLPKATVIPFVRDYSKLVGVT
ncbi:hypothetical protein Scep_021992 [Stephania cephalantha]|uniref:Uncharacterized protein n=1 Tax=Stephania cephalantha TaxID=152367 RepID=A0AAP0HXB2_9MAGN